MRNPALENYDLVNNAKLARQTGDLQKAIDLYTQFLNQFPDNSEVLRMRAEVYAQMGDMKKALVDYFNMVIVDGSSTDQVIDRIAELSVVDFLNNRTAHQQPRSPAENKSVLSVSENIHIDNQRRRELISKGVSDKLLLQEQRNRQDEDVRRKSQQEYFNRKLAELKNHVDNYDNNNQKQIQTYFSLFEKESCFQDSFSFNKIYGDFLVKKAGHAKTDLIKIAILNGAIGKYKNALCYDPFDGDVIAIIETLGNEIDVLKNKNTKNVINSLTEQVLPQQNTDNNLNLPQNKSSISI